MPWFQLIFESDAEQAPRVADWLDAVGAVSVTLNDSADQPLYEPPPGATPLWNRTTVVGLFPDDADMEATLIRLAEQSAPEPLPTHRLEALPDQDWERAWMDAFEPMRFGERLWIVPSWHTPPEPAAVNILLDPGLAFGTGTHPTTRLCLEWLDGLELDGCSVIDYGAGSGILAIAAALLGASTVLAVDNDPQALLATEDNARRNGVERRIDSQLPQHIPAVQADLLIANILAGPLIALSARLAHLVRPGGQLGLSGILPDQAEAVLEAYRPWFDMDAPTEHEGWIRLNGRRTGG